MVKLENTLTEDFKFLADVFKPLGYNSLWIAGEWRSLPDDLAEKLLAAGLKLRTPIPNAPESTINKKE